MREISSKEYAELISKTNDTKAIAGDMDKDLDKAYRAGVIHATKHFMTIYKMARDEFSSRESGLSFEALDYLFNNCASTLIGEGVDE